MENGSAEEQVRRYYVQTHVKQTCFSTQGFDSLTLACEFASECVVNSCMEYGYRNPALDNLRKASTESDTLTRAMLRYSMRDAAATLGDALAFDEEDYDASAFDEDEWMKAVQDALASRLALAVNSGGHVRIDVLGHVCEVTK